MDPKKAIELLNNAAYGHEFTFDDEFKEACTLGAKALALLTQDKAHRLSKLSRELLLGS